MMLGELEEGLGDIPIVSEVGGLKRIHDKKAEAVLWDRELPDAVESWLSDISRSDWSNGRFWLYSKDIHRCVVAHFQSNGIDQVPELEWLASDIQSLAEELSAQLSSAKLRLRLEVITNDACRKFHVDNVTVRLICTYAGPGTEYGVLGDNQSPETVRRAPTGMPMLFKGLKWPASENRLLKHRSPPIEETGQTRFVVVLEPISPGTEQLNESYRPFPPRR